MDETDAPNGLTVAAALDSAVQHHKAGRLARARELYAAVLEAQPKNFNALHLLGVLARHEGDLSASIRLISEALAIAPTFAVMYANLGVALLERGQLDLAAQAYRTAMTIAPHDPGPHRHLLHALLFQPGLNPARRLAAHLEFAARHQPAPEQALPAPENGRAPERRIRVGLLSSDLRAHPVAGNLLPLLRWRDRAATEILCYAEVAMPDTVSEAIRNQCDGWRSTVGLDDRAVAALIRRDRIDLLVVLAARFDLNRPLVACYRPAPVQISMFDGATTALRGIDYCVSDPILTPPDTTERFAEPVALVPRLMVFPPIEDAPPVTRSPVGATARVAFGSFNNPSKVGSRAVELWARVLHAVPGSCLLLKYRTRYQDIALQERLRIGFGALGIDPARLRFLPNDEAQTTHLAAYGAVDIALDTTPFSGATTTFEALWMGVPTLALAGDTMISRMTASLLSAAGLSELIAPSADDFVERAAALARDVERRAALRAELRDRVARSPLCDGPAYARSIERLWRSLWRNWCSGSAG